MKKQIKDLKVGDNLYFLNTDRNRVTVNKVINIEDSDDEYLKITWEKEEYSDFPNYCFVREEDTSFWEEPDYDDDDYEEDEDLEDEERLVLVNREDLISRIEEEISRLQKEIKELP